MLSLWIIQYKNNLDTEDWLGVSEKMHEASCTFVMDSGCVEELRSVLICS